MISLRYLRENSAKLRENWRVNSVTRPTSGFVYLRYRRVYRVTSKGAGIRMNTAPPTRVQYSWFVRAQGYNKMTYGYAMGELWPLRCFLFVLPNYTNISVFSFLFALFSDEPEVFLPKYSQTAILHASLLEGSKLSNIQIHTNTFHL